MKKGLMVVLAMVLFALSALPAMADENELVSIRRSFLVNGAHQRYMPIAFEVPTVNSFSQKVIH